MPIAGFRQPPEKWPTCESESKRKEIPRAPSNPSLVGESLADFVINTVITSTKVQIISIIKAFMTVKPVAGFNTISSDSGTDPRK
jgi:hypothetical protein